MLQYYKYHIPFKTPFRVSGQELSDRKGIILVYKEGDIDAYGEVAPLPGFSLESLAEVEEVLKVNRKHLQQTLQAGSGRETLNVLDQIHQFPSLSFGLDTLLHDLAAKREGKPLVKYLFPDFESSVLCNATLSIQNQSKTLAAAKGFIEEGFKTFKIKVGENLELESRIIREIRKQFPQVNIRIDANEAWTTQEAIRNLNTLQPLQIEYCEQPISRDNLSALKKVKDSVKIPVAADESARNKRSITELSEMKAANLIVVKPMLMGTFNNIFVTNDLAVTHNIETVFTSSFETAVGRAAIAALAAGLCRKSRAQGLATGINLENDLASENWLNKPKILFSKSPGLGILLDLKEQNEL